MIAGKMMDPVMGIDIHIIQPPGPVPPVPIPHPFIGMVVDPMDLAPIVGATVMVNSMPRATAGTGCKNIPPHIPIGGTFIKPPGNEGEIFMGSATVLADGSPLSFLALPVLSCSDVGMPPPPRPKKKGGAKSLALPTTVLMAIPVGMPVMVGGPPTIDMMAMAMKAGMAGLGKAFKKLKATKAMKKASDKLHDAAEAAMKKMKVPKNARNKVHKGICSVTGHPVDIASGKVFTDRVDFEIPGPIPFSWERTWFSTSIYEGPLGHGWHHSYDMGMVVDERAGYVAVKLSDGRNVVFPTLAVGEDTYDRQEKLSLFRDKTGYYVRDKERLLYRFGAPVDGIQALESVGNAAGFKIQFAYTPQGFLRQVTDSAGRIFTFDTDQDGRVTAIHAPHPDKAGETFPIMRYGYDAYGDMTQATDALGHSFQFDYANHLLVKETNRNGLSFYFEYDGIDSSAKCIHTWGDGGIYDHKLTYAGGITVVENSLGHKTTHFHDGAVVHKRVDAMGGEHLTRYNEFYEVIEEVDPLERSTRYEYDERGNQALKVFPDESTIQSQYEDDLLVSRVDQVGGTWRWEYDENERLKLQVDSEGAATKYKTSLGMPEEVIDAANNRYFLEYDESFNLKSLVSLGNVRYEWKYDRLSRNLSSSDPSANFQTKELDLLGQVVKVIDPDGNVRSIKYDNEANPILMKDSRAEIQLEFDGFNVLTKRIENGNRVEFYYDTEEQLIAIKNENGFQYKFELNANGEIELESGFDGVKIYYKRDKTGQIASILYASGIEAIYSNDLLGRVTEIIYSNGEFEKYSYRADGELLEAQNNNSKVIFERDNLGRVIKELTGEFSINTTYDSLGNRIETKSSLGAHILYNRDSFGHIIGIKATNGSWENMGRNRSDSQIPWSGSFERDAQGKELKRSLPGNLECKWTRDELGRPIRQEINSGKAKPRLRDYFWQSNETLRQITDNLNGVSLFEYDNSGRLISANYGSKSTKYRFIDEVGNLFENRDKLNRQYGPDGRLIKANGTEFQYDPLGNLIKKTTQDNKIWKFSWTASGMLKMVILPNGEKVEFYYDALGRRIHKIKNNKRTNWIWDGIVPFHEWEENMGQSNLVLTASDKSSLGTKKIQIRVRDGSQYLGEEKGYPANISPDKKSNLVTWVFEGESFAPMAKLEGNRNFSIISDHLGTPKFMYDDEGNLIWEAELGIWGEMLNQFGDKSDCPFRFPGQYEDIETGLYYNYWRYFDPDMGRYISQDPIRLNGGLNLYQYVNNPNVEIDPFGLAKMRCGDPDKLRELGLDGVNLRGASFNAGKKRLEKAGFVYQGSTRTGRKTFVHPRTGTRVHYDGTPGSLAGRQDPHWHVQGRGGEYYGENGLPAAEDTFGGHIPSNKGNSQF